jgi:predicted O-methyltransferase YrrM
MNEIYDLKPKSIFDVVDKEFFIEYDDRDGPSNGHDYMHCEDYYELYYAISKFYQPESILEIGVRYGYSLYSLVKGSDKVNFVLGYDIDEYDEGSLAVAEKNLKEFLSDDIEIIMQNENTQGIQELDGFVDMIHIDGDHSYDGKLHDLEITKQKCKVLIIDDYEHIREVKMATDDFIRKNKSIIKNHYLLKSFRGTYIIEY